MLSNILVLVADYPRPDGSRALMYVHTRNLYYMQQGIGVTVLNFSCSQPYTVDGIQVFSFDDYQKSDEHYDVLVAHAPNLRNHYRFLKRFERRFAHIVFFFHGHEVLRVNHAYPRPYSYKRKLYGSFVLARELYDPVKLFLWRHYYKKLAEKSYFIFVSKWMLNEFLKSTKICPEDLKGHERVIYNSIGEHFEKQHYIPVKEPSYDFITIRGNLDGSKYCIDVVNKLAWNNPSLRFLVIGEGVFFQHNAKPENLTLINKSMSHEEIIAQLRSARCALMPTRTDAQGLMACEIASFGMPMITSDIPVCHEIFDSFDNVALISNDDPPADLGAICEQLEKDLPYPRNEKYFACNTCAREVELLRSLSSWG